MVKSKYTKLLFALLFGLVQLVFLGDVFPELVLWVMERKRANRWYRSAAWAGWFCCGLGGALIIVAGVVWGMTRRMPEQGSIIMGNLLLAGMVLCLVASFVIGGLLAIGYIVQGNKETREWASSLGRNKGRMGTPSLPEDTLHNVIERASNG